MAADPEVGAAGSEPRPALAQSYPLSVVIPVHNAEAALRRCLEALLGNDLDNVEITVVDDASRDGCSRVISALRHRHRELDLKVERLERQGGPARARNLGLERSRHPYLLFLDADVVLPPRSLEWIRDTLDLYSHRQDVAGVLGGYDERAPWPDFLASYKNLYVCFLYQQTETLSPYLHTPILCIRREVLEQAGGFDPSLATGEDFRLGVALGSRGFRFVIDRRIKGTHLKRYSLADVLREDWRRIRDLGSMRLGEEEKRFAMRAHRLHRLLSVAAPLPALLFAALAALHPAYGVIALILVALFAACNLSFFLYCVKHRGFLFALSALAFLFVEMTWAALGLVLAGRRDAAT